MATKRKSASKRVRKNVKAKYGKSRNLKAKATSRKSRAGSPAAPSIAAPSSAARAVMSSASTVAQQQVPANQGRRLRRGGSDSGVESRRHLIVVPHAGEDAAASPAAIAAPSPALHVRAVVARGTTDLSSVLRRAGATIQPLFDEAQLMPRVASMTPSPPSTREASEREAFERIPPPAELGKYQVVKAADERLEDLAAELIGQGLVAAAYVQPEIFPPVAPRSRATHARARAIASVPLASPLPPEAPTPDFTDQQGYLGPSPDGVDAFFAWTQPGGKGDGVSVIDIEGGWCFTHEDLRHTVGGLVGGTALGGSLWRDHGTSVLSEIVAEENGIGVTGIAPRASVTAVSHSPDGAGPAIMTAARRLRAGDIMLLEMHAPGPRLNFRDDPMQRGFIAMEWWPEVFAAVSFAVRRGIIVVSAAGNGAEDLDDPLYSVRPTTPPHVFDRSWVNPFDRTRRDSGSIIVGAGAPPGNVFGLDRTRLGFSNFGELIDAQGWGAGVVACGKGDLQNGVEERLYTATFSGTSSASPIVVGALACIQGIRKAMGRAPLTPAQARDLLRSTGAPQSNGGQPITERIGNRPDVRAMMAAIPP